MNKKFEHVYSTKHCTWDKNLMYQTNRNAKLKEANLAQKLTLKVRIAIPLNFPLSGKVMQSISMILPHPSKKLLMSSSDE